MNGNVWASFVAILQKEFVHIRRDRATLIAAFSIPMFQLVLFGFIDQTVKNLPTVIIGDYNDWRNTLSRGALRDASFAHVTSPISRFRTFPAYLPLGSLDKLFVRGSVFVRHARVRRDSRNRSWRTASGR